MRKLLFCVLALMICSGCSTAPILDFTNGTPLAPATSPTVVTSTVPAPSLSPVSTLAAPPTLTDTIEPDTDATPEPIVKPGVWIIDGEYGVDGQDAKEYYEGAALQPASTDSDPSEPDFSPEPTADLSDPDIAAVAKVQIRIGSWVYFFDVTRPDSSTDFNAQYLICRRNDSGSVQDLGIYGFEFIAVPGYLYVNSNYHAEDFVYWDTFRVSLDGKDKRYVGGNISLYVPSQGNYLYFTGYDYDLYRSDYSFTHVERIVVDIPDKAKIEKEIQPGLQVFDEIKTKGDWFYLRLFAYNLDGGTYWGNYKMKLNGGKATKTDKGELSTASPDDVSGDDSGD